MSLRAPGLKPDLFACLYGTAEAVPFHLTSQYGRATRVAFVAAGLMLLSACGGHKTAHQKVPPPPTVTPSSSEVRHRID